jgi:hypothetical protein
MHPVALGPHRHELVLGLVRQGFDLPPKLAVQAPALVVMVLKALPRA